MPLDRVQERPVVAVDVLADREHGDPPVRDAQVGQDGAREDEGLLARDVRDRSRGEEIARFLGVGGEFSQG